MIRILGGPLLPLVFVFSAAALWPRGRRPGPPSLPSTPYRYATVELPGIHHRAESRQHACDNPLTDEGATPDALFYDRRLSANRTTACASCHLQARVCRPEALQQGFHGARTDRRAMPLVNLRYYARARFFWDERAGNLEEMVLLPIQSRIEMGQDLSGGRDARRRCDVSGTLRARLWRPADYRSANRKALAQFVRSLVSYQSRYDEVWPAHRPRGTISRRSRCRRTAARRSSCATAAPAT